MNVEEEHTARLLRDAVGDAGARWADGRLPERLLAGVRRRRQRRAASGALLSAVMVTAAAGGWAVWSPQERDALVAGPGPDVEQPDGRPTSPLQARAVLPEQAARAGLDGTSQCQSQAVLTREGVPASATAPGQEVTAGYLTDTAGYERWEQEFSGSRTEPVDGPVFPGIPVEEGSPSGITPYGPGMVALCWFEGDIPPDTSSPGGPSQPRFRLLAIQFTGSPGGIRLDMISEGPIPVLAPPRPNPSLIPADMALDDVVHPQPDGVPVVDVLVERPRSPAPDAGGPATGSAPDAAGCGDGEPQSPEASAQCLYAAFLDQNREHAARHASDPAVESMFRLGGFPSDGQWQFDGCGPPQHTQPSSGVSCRYLIPGAVHGVTVEMAMAQDLSVEAVESIG